MDTTRFRRGGSSHGHSQMQGNFSIQTHTLHSLTHHFQASILEQDPNESHLKSNSSSDTPALSDQRTPKSKGPNKHSSPQTDTNTPTQGSLRESSTSTPRARPNLDCLVRSSRRDSDLDLGQIGSSASTRYQLALRLDDLGADESGVQVEQGTSWRNVWASLRNGEISIWSERSSSISSPDSPLCVIHLSSFNHSSTSSADGSCYAITLSSKSSDSRSTSYGSAKAQTQQVQTMSQSQSPKIDQDSSPTFHWPRSLSRSSLMKSSSSRTLADALRFGSDASTSEEDKNDSNNNRGLSHSQSQSTLNADVKENRKERSGGAWARIFPRSRRLKSFISASASSDSLSDQSSIKGSTVSSIRYGGEGMPSEDGTDRGNSISSSPLSRSTALPSPGFSSSSHSTAATSVNQSPITSSWPKTQPPSNITLRFPSTTSMNQWADAIRLSSKTFQPERSEASAPNGPGRKRLPLTSIPGFSSPLNASARDAYSRTSVSTNPVNHQQSTSPTLSSRHQQRSATLPSSQSESILVIQATSEGRLSQRRKEKADTARTQDIFEQASSNVSPSSNLGEEEADGAATQDKQNPTPVATSGRTGLSALLGRKRARGDLKKPGKDDSVDVSSPNDTALHRQVQTCRASIETSAGSPRRTAEFYRPSTSSGASLKSFGSGKLKDRVGKAARRSNARPSSAAGYEHAHSRNSFTLTSGLTHAQKLAKQYLARETTPSPDPSSASRETAPVLKCPAESDTTEVPFLRELASCRTTSPLTKEAMLPELPSLSIPSGDGRGRLRAASPQFRSTSPLSNHSSVPTPTTIAESLYTPGEGTERALDRFARVRSGSCNAHGLGLEGVDLVSSSPASGSTVPQSRPHQAALKRLKATPSRGSIDSNREEELEEAEPLERRTSLNGSALGISFGPSSALTFKSSSPALSSASNSLGLTTSPSLRGLAHKLLRPSSASGIASPLHFSSSRTSGSEPRASRDSESSSYGGRASSGDASANGRSLEFDNEIDIDYEMIPSPRVIPPSTSLPVINLPTEADHQTSSPRIGYSTPSSVMTESTGNGQEKSSLGRKTRKTAERWANRLGSSPRINNSTIKVAAGPNNAHELFNSTSTSEGRHPGKPSSSSSTASSPPIVERILPPEQIISIIDNMRDGGGRGIDSTDVGARINPKPAPRARRARPRTDGDLNPDSSHPPSASSNRRALGSIQSSNSEQSGLSLPPPPRMSKRSSATSLATLEKYQGEELYPAASFSTPHVKSKRLPRSASEAAISNSTPIRDLNSAFPSPVRRSRRQDVSEDKENESHIGRKRSNSTLSCQSSSDRDSKEVLLEADAAFREDVDNSSASELLSDLSSDWTTFENHKTLTSSTTSNTFVNLKASGKADTSSQSLGGDESFGTLSASNSCSSTLEGSQEAVLFHVTGKPVITQR